MQMIVAAYLFKGTTCESTEKVRLKDDDELKTLKDSNFQIVLLYWSFKSWGPQGGVATVESEYQY